jgi:hypothetical protein
MLGRQLPLLSKIKTKKVLLASHKKWILWPGHPKHSQNHSGLAEGQPDEPLSKKIWPPSSKLTQKCHLATQGQWILWPSRPKHS